MKIYALKDIRSFLVSLFIFFLLALIGEFLVGPMMGDAIPLWKILVVSLITAFMSVVPLQKRGLKPGDIFKYFKRQYFAPEAELNSLYTKIIARFPTNLFKVSIKAEAQTIEIRRKPNWQSFGEVIRIKLSASQVDVLLRPKYYLDLFDQGQAYESIQRIEEIVQNEISPT